MLGDACAEMATLGLALLQGRATDGLRTSRFRFISRDCGRYGSQGPSTPRRVVVEKGPANEGFRPSTGTELRRR